MARSIHTTRRELDELHRERFTDPERKAEALESARAALARKRRIKEQVVVERRRDEDAMPLVDPAGIPIEVRDQAEHVVHAASPEDLVAVMRRLPPGMVDGIAKIVLGLGREHPEYDDEEHGESDPFSGRRGDEIVPGVYCGRVLGVYWPDSASITLCAYVLAPAVREQRVIRFYLRAQALSTFVHEVAHHHDQTARVARGRWLADDRDHAEIYAERSQHRLAQEVVVPYLEAEYADDVAHVRAWMRHHGGVELPLSALLGDPRTTAVATVPFFALHTAFEILLADVMAGGEPDATRVEFANQLHYGGEYTIARAILAGVLAAQPDHLVALALEGDIDVHEGAFERAETIARRVLALDPTHDHAWEVLVDALQGQARWTEVVEAASQAIPLVRYPGIPLRRRARAFFELGDDARLEADLCALALGGTAARRAARTLRARWLIRAGRADEAAAITDGA